MERPNGTLKTISLLLIHARQSYREDFTSLLLHQPGFSVRAHAGDITQALLDADTQSPDIILLDAELVSADLPRCLDVARAAYPLSKLVVVDMRSSGEYVAQMVKAGVSGFVMRDAPFSEAVATIREVANDASVLPRDLTNSLFREIVGSVLRARPSHTLDMIGLTPREREVIVLLSEGLSNKEISARLNVVVHTVKSHVHNILEKLALRTRLEVAAYTRVEHGHVSAANVA
ncbi:MAG: response regulator transcription factor [Gemmatimonadota bacterium]